MEYLPNFQLHRPETVEDAVKARTGEDEALYVAGGTDMLVNVRRGIEQPQNDRRPAVFGADDEDGLRVAAPIGSRNWQEVEG